MDAIARLNKIYADAPDDFAKSARPGFCFDDRELDALVGPLTYDEAAAACDAMPRGYNEFTRNRLHHQIAALRGCATAFWFGREASVCIYFAADMTDEAVRAIFPEADEVDHSPNPQTGDEMCRVWWD